MVMPLDLGVKIGTDDSVQLLLEVTEGMDYRELNAAYDRQTKADESHTETDASVGDTWIHEWNIYDAGS